MLDAPCRGDFLPECRDIKEVIDQGAGQKRTDQLQPVRRTETAEQR